MLIQQVLQFSRDLERALAAGDLESIHHISLECDRVLRVSLPRAQESGEDLAELVTQLQRLSALYQQAMAIVEEARNRLRDQLHSLGRGKANTHTYLNVAGHFGQ